jgi:hypothetical protein
MSEPEKRGSPWPWILVPIAAVSLFFVLRECRQSLPPADSVPDHAAADASSPDMRAAAVPQPAEPETAPASSLAPQ